jgi:outer membrane protein OmpA-like peptidoglycan-associated protein
MEYESASKMQPAGNDFSKALFSEYLALSKTEMEAGDVRSSNAFALNAKMAGQGAEVQPEEVAAHRLPAADAAGITQARGQLMAALAQARQRAPADAAKAQAQFDCWIVQAEKRSRPTDLKRCSDGFQAALAKIRPAAATAAAPAAPAGPPQKFVVYFDRNSANLNSAANDTIARAAALAKDSGSVDVVGYTDSSGSPRANFNLSAKRADAVTAGLVKGGVAAPRISQASMGENNPAVQTADNVREDKNRRVEITVTK